MPGRRVRQDPQSVAERREARREALAVPEREFPPSPAGTRVVDGGLEEPVGVLLPQFLLYPGGRQGVALRLLVLAEVHVDERAGVAQPGELVPVGVGVQPGPGACQALSGRAMVVHGVTVGANAPVHGPQLPMVGWLVLGGGSRPPGPAV